MKVKFNPSIQEIRGKLGNMVFRMCHTGEWQIARRPDMRKVKWSEAQKAHRRRFRLAAEYAKVCMKIPELRAYYLKQAHKRGTNRPYDEAVRDYFKDNNLVWDTKKRDEALKVINCAPSIPVQPYSGPQPEAIPHDGNVAINEQNRPQRAGFASSSSTKAVPAPAGGPATNDDRWIVASLVMSDYVNEGDDFYSVSTMCVLEYGNAVGLPQYCGS